VQVLARYPRICINLKKYIETMPLLTRFCATMCTARDYYIHHHHFHTKYDVQKQSAIFEMVNKPKIIPPIE